MNVLVLDVGTSSMRGTLYSPRGDTICKRQEEYVSVCRGDACEIDAHILKDSLFRITCACVQQSKRAGASIDGIALTAQRSSVLPVDKHCRPLRNAITWQDKRATDICTTLAQHVPTIYQTSGMRPSPVFSAPKMAWLKRNENEIYQSAHKLIGFHEYLLWQMTGRFCTDDTIGSRTCLMDVHSRTWSEELLGLFELDQGKLCEIIPAGSIAGLTTGAFAADCGLDNTVPVISAGGDQQAAALGLGCLRHGQIEVNIGTGAYVIASCGHPILDPEMQLICNTSLNGHWILEGASLSSGDVVRWMNEQFFHGPNQSYPYEAFDLALARAPAGAHGLIFSPCLSGKGAPFWDSSACGTIHGISLQHTKDDFARALVEGIVSEAAECLEIIRRLLGAAHIDSLHCAGGLTKNAVFNQIQSDTYGHPVSVFSDAEATSLGAWMVGAVALSLFATHEEAFCCASTTRTKRVFEPKAEAVALYARNRRTRRALYQATANMHRMEGSDC